MHELLEGLLIAGAAAWAALVLAVLWVRHRVRRQLRIAPRARSTAPTLWVASPTAPARLHRRLRRAAATARTASTLDPALAILADDLVAEALALEAPLLTVARLGRAETTVRRRLAARVGELEAVARQLTRLATASATESTRSAHLRDRTAALAAARQELLEIDRRAGLLRQA